jgi:hypothetical protein
MAPPEPPIRAFRRRLLRLIDEQFDGRYTVFARRAGIPVSTMQHYLHHARHLPGGEHLMRMAAAFGVTVQALLTGPEAVRRAPRPLPPVPVGQPGADRQPLPGLTIPVVRCGCPGPCPLTEEERPAVAGAMLSLPTELLAEHRAHRLLATPVGAGFAAAEWSAGTWLVVDTDARTPTWEALALVHTEGHCHVGHLTQIEDTLLFGPERDGDFRVIQGGWRILGTICAVVVPLTGDGAPTDSGPGRRGQRRRGTVAGRGPTHPE